jgi:hypothetical protein
MTSNIETSNALTVQNHYQAPAIDAFDHDDPAVSPVRGAMSNSTAVAISSERKRYPSKLIAASSLSIKLLVGSS